jgi:hypothetical protein
MELGNRGKGVLIEAITWFGGTRTLSSVHASPSSNDHYGEEKKNENMVITSATEINPARISVRTVINRLAFR